MKIRTYLILISIIFLTSSASALILFFFVDIEKNFELAYITMGISMFLSISSFVWLTLSFLKKIHYRWEVHTRTITASLRQGCLMAILIIGMIALESLSVLTWKTGMLLSYVLLFIELIFQTISDS